MSEQATGKPERKPGTVPKLVTKPSVKRNSYSISYDDGHIIYDEPPDQDKDTRAFVTRFNLFDARLASIHGDTRAWDSIARTAMDGLDYHINYDMKETGLALFAEAERRLASYEARRDSDEISRTVSRNTTIFYAGMMTGIVASCVFFSYVSEPLLARSDMVPMHHLPVVVMFAALGSFVSYRTRLEQIDIHKPVRWPDLVLAGFMGPVLAIVVALVVYVMIQGMGLQVRIAGAADTGTTQAAIVIVAAFLCGWSERFAKDALARVR